MIDPVEEYYRKKQARADEVLPYLAWMFVILVICCILATAAQILGLT